MLKMSNALLCMVHSAALMKLAEMEYCGTTRYLYSILYRIILMFLKDFSVNQG